MQIPVGTKEQAGTGMRPNLTRSQSGFIFRRSCTQSDTSRTHVFVAADLKELIFFIYFYFSPNSGQQCLLCHHTVGIECEDLFSTGVYRMSAKYRGSLNRTPGVSYSASWGNLSASPWEWVPYGDDQSSLSLSKVADSPNQVRNYKHT